MYGFYASTGAEIPFSFTNFPNFRGSLDFLLTEVQFLFGASDLGRKCAMQARHLAFDYVDYYKNKNNKSRNVT